MLVALLLAAWGVAQVPATLSPDLTTWKLVLVIQAVPYACALLVSLTSALSLPAWLVGTRYRGTAELARAASGLPAPIADQIGGNSASGGAEPAFISGSLSSRSIANV